MFAFHSFEYTSQQAAYLVDKEVFTTNRVHLDKTLLAFQANVVLTELAKQKAIELRKELEEKVGLEVADGKFICFASNDDRMYLVELSGRDGFVNVIKVNKQKPRNTNTDYSIFNAV